MRGIEGQVGIVSEQQEARNPKAAACRNDYCRTLTRASLSA